MQMVVAGFSDTAFPVTENLDKNSHEFIVRGLREFQRCCCKGG